MAAILITGTNRGLGLEFVQQYLQRGERVIATCRNPDESDALQELAASNPILSLLPLEVSDAQSMAVFAEAIKDEAIDVFINNAGVYGPRDANFGNVSGEDWEEVLKINSIAPILLTQLIIGSLRQGSEQMLVYITSKMGSIDDNRCGGSYIYRSSKKALN